MTINAKLRILGGIMLATAFVLLINWGQCQRNVGIYNIGADGSSIKVEPENWSVSGIYYLPSIKIKAFHGFGNGPPGKESIHVEIGYWGKPKPIHKHPADIAKSFRNLYDCGTNKGIKVRKTVLSNRKKFYYLISKQLVANQLAGTTTTLHYVLDGFFGHGSDIYYVCAIADVKQVSFKKFKIAVPDILEIVGAWQK